MSRVWKWIDDKNISKERKMEKAVSCMMVQKRG